MVFKYLLMILAGEKQMVFGRELIINPLFVAYPPYVSVDIETDEKDNFVGAALYGGTTEVHYYTALTDGLKQALSVVQLVAHNAKFDVRLLKKWGVAIKTENIAYDTMLASYSNDCGAETHALKPLAEKFLGYKWHTYKDMTETRTTSELIHRFKMEKGEDGKRHKRVLDTPEIEKREKVTKTTLDKLPVPDVAAYCASDAVACWDLMRYFERTMTPEAKWIFSHLEMPTLRIVFAMEERGIRIDRKRLNELDVQFQEEMRDIRDRVWGMIGEPININSSKQLAPHLERILGQTLPLTEKGNSKTSKDVLQIYTGHPLVDLLLEYSQVKKLVTAFTQPLLDRGDRVHPTFNQVVRENEHDEQVWGGIATGRLSCSNPNLQQIPRRSMRGKLLRELFIPEEGEALICADFSQIEPRILAHMSKDSYLINVFREEKDVYEALIKGTNLSRDDGKTFYLALVYMAQPKKLAKVFKCTVEEAEKIFKACWKNVPGVKRWQDACLILARKLGGVRTLFKRFRGLPHIKSGNWKERASAERRAINTPIQGSAADIMKLAMIAVEDAGYKIRLVVHDEILISVEKERVEHDVSIIKALMEDVTKLLVPIKVDMGYGASWGHAKETH